MKTKSSLGITTCVRNQDGQALIFITLAFLVLGMFIGLAVDGGRAYLMRERLRKIVDAAALAGAKAMAAVAAGSDAEAAAKNAACESAMVNGLSRSDCFTEKLAIEIEDLTNPDGTTQRGVVATGTDRGRTFFMSLGALLGCSVCKEINVAATGKAVPDTLADIVLVLDDTGTMSDGCNAAQDNENCPIRSAKAGANIFMDLIFAADQNGHTKIGYVPFRGCYKSDRNLPDPLLQNYRNQGFGDAEIARWGCILWDELQELTADKTAIAQKIATRRGSKGFPGTNLCLAMVEGRKKLFGPEGRSIARKIMVILSDGSQNYSDSADGPQPAANPPIPNWGNPIPTPYPNQKYDPANGGDQGTNSTPSCMPTQTPGHETLRWGGGGANFNLAMAQQDNNARNLAASLKNTDRVEIYFLRFTSSEQGDALTSGDPPGACDPGLVGNQGGNPGIERSGTDGVYNRHSASNDIRDRNLARCLASNTAMGDPFSRAPNDHYFFAPTANAIRAQLEAIARDILNKRRLVG